MGMFNRSNIVTKSIMGLATAAIMAFIGNASATSISWQTNTMLGSCEAGYTCDSSSRTFLGDDGTTLVTATAWAYNTSSGQIASGDIGFYLNGLGVTNSPGDGSHTVDNQGWVDFVAFKFSEAVDMESVTPSTYSDTDITVWIGDTVGTPDFSGDSFADLDAAFGPSFNNYGGNSNRTATFGANGEAGNLMIVAAISNGNDGYYDNFKIKALAAAGIDTDPDDVPAPASLLVFGPAVFGLGVYRRQIRKADKAKKDQQTEEISDDEVSA